MVAIDINGQVFGRLTVISRGANTANGSARFYCKCMCGNQLLVRSAALRSGKTKSCGCYHRDRIKEIKLDLTGKFFGSWLVISRAANKRHEIMWECLCVCGVTRNVKSCNLVSGASQSCGCRMKQLARARYLKDMAGLTFERWRVLNLDTESRGNHARWICVCQCGTIKSVRGDQLSAGESKSCGCLQVDIATRMCVARRGADNPNWRGGITPVNKQIRKSSEYKEWRNAVFTRDNYTCQHCNTQGGKLHPHHLNPFSDFPLLRFDVNNGQTLCEACHRKTPTYGNKKRLKPQNELTYAPSTIPQATSSAEPPIT